MKTLIRDTDEYYYRIITIDNDTDVISLVSSFIQELAPHADSLNCKIENDGHFVASFELDSDLEDIEFQLSLIDEKNKVTLELKCEKKSDQVLRVISPEEFIEYIAEQSYDLQLKFWLEKLSENYSSVLVGDQSIDLKSYSEYPTAELVKRHRQDTIASLVGVKMNVCYFDFLLEKFDNFSPIFFHLLEMRTALCLCLISRSCDIAKKKFDFDGNNQVDLFADSNRFAIEHGQAVYQVFQWAYSDERISARIGVINQVISQSKNIIKVFDCNVIKVLDSIYQVYIKEDFEQYIEVRNKVSDTTLELCNRINEAVSASRATIKQSIFVILSYFFSIIVFTAIDKGKIENILTLELTVLSTVFLCAAFLNIWFSSNEMYKNIEIYKYQLSEIESRNRVFLSESEVSDFFNSKSLTKSLEASESKSYLYVSFFVLAVLIIVLWIFHFTRTSLVGIPVLLHII